jgi:hypothetical protein
MPLFLAAFVMMAVAIFTVGRISDEIRERQHVQFAADAMVLAVSYDRDTTAVIRDYGITSYRQSETDGVVFVEVWRRGLRASATATQHAHTLNFE